MDVRFYPAPPANVGSCSLPTDPSCLSSLDYYHSNKVNNKLRVLVHANALVVSPVSLCVRPNTARSSIHPVPNACFGRISSTNFAPKLHTLKKCQVSPSKSDLSSDGLVLIYSRVGRRICYYSNLVVLKPAIFMVLKENVLSNFLSFNQRDYCVISPIRLCSWFLHIATVALKVSDVEYHELYRIHTAPLCSLLQHYLASQ